MQAQAWLAWYSHGWTLFADHVFCGVAWPWLLRQFCSLELALEKSYRWAIAAWTQWLSKLSKRQVRRSAQLSQYLLDIIPRNPIKAMVDGDMLAIIFFSIIIGVGILLCRGKGEIAWAIFSIAPQKLS